MANSFYTITVYSSNGNLLVNAKTGGVLACELHPDGDEHLQAIRGFDLHEWKETYQGRELPQTLDILDLGYLYTSDNQLQYEEPASDWRAEFGYGDQRCWV